MGERWTPGIGDPSLVGWLTVLCYAAAALACIRAARRPPPCGSTSSPPEYRRFWIGMAAVLTLLGVNKQLDLQSLLTQLLRDMARSDGWYDHRRALQAWFIGAMAIVGVAGLIIAMLRARSWSDAQRIAFCGIAMVFVYVLIRAASFHHVDWLINQRILSVKVNWWIELSGILLVLLATIEQIPFRIIQHNR